jgi:hypothetical protein
VLSAKGEGTRWSHENVPESQRSEGLTGGVVSALSGTDLNTRCPNFQRRKSLAIAGPILGYYSDALIIVECGPRTELRRPLDECSLSSALLPILSIISSPGGVEIKSILICLHILFARGSLTVVV